MAKKKPGEGGSRKRRGRGEGGICQRPDGIWEASASLGIGADGKRKRVRVFGKTKAEALEKLRKFQAAGGQVSDFAAKPMADWLNHWLAVVANSIEPNTIRGYKSQVELHLIPRIGRVKLSAFRPADVRALYAKMLADGVSPAMTRKVGTALTIALNAAVRDEVVPGNPAAGIKKPKAQKPKIEVLSRDDAAKLAKFCRDRGGRLDALFLLVLDSGCRPGEALALTWGDVDAKGVAFTKSLEEIDGAFRIKKPKTKRSSRRVELSPTTLAELERHRKRMADEGRDVTAAGLVFCNTKGGFVSMPNLHSNTWKPLLAAAKLPAVTPYALRHTCATLLLIAGVNPKVVAERLGHSSITLTLDTYSHVLPGMQAGAAAALDAVFSENGHNQATSAPKAKKGKSS
mgnify:CR=1 FL=1